MINEMTPIASCLMTAAEQLLAAGKLDQAQYCYRQALQLAPDSVDLHLKLGNVLQQLAQYAEAIASYQKVIELEPDFWEGYHCLGDTLRHQQQWHSAIEAYRQAIALNPEFCWSHYHLGSSLFQLELYAEAANCYQQAIALKSEFWQGYHGLADSYKRLAQLPAAIEAYQQAIQFKPDFFWSHYNLGIIYLEQEQWSEAIATLEQAQKIDPHYAPLAVQLGKALHQQGNRYLDQARTYYHQAIARQPQQLDLLSCALQIQPDNLQLCQQLGKVLLKQEQFKSLIEQYQITLGYPTQNQQSQLYGELHHDLATAWLTQGNFEQAIANWQKALEYHPEHLEAHLQLASHWLLQDQPDNALSHYRQALAFTSDPETTNYCQYAIARLTGNSFSQGQKNAQQHIVLYTDCPQIYGAEQSSHVLMKGLVAAGYRVTCMQSQAENYLITARKQLGIAHYWISGENVDCIADYQNYQGVKLPTALYDALESAWSFAQTQPDLIIFADACIMSSIVAKQMAAQLNIPFIIITHRVHQDATRQFAPYLNYLPQVYQQAEEVVVVSQNNLDLLHQQFSLESGKGRVIYNGIDAKFFSDRNLTVRQQIRQALNIPNDAIVLSTNARLDVEKGYQFQLEAIAQLQNSAIWSQLYFVWSGEGGYTHHLEQKVKELNVQEKVKFLGKRDDIPDLLDAGDIFLMPSLYEGMPIAIMEAMAKGLPVIATAVSGVPEELGNTGKLLPNPTIDAVATVQELVDTIIEWTQNAELRTAIGQQCQQRAKQLFTEEQAIAQYLDIF